MAQVSVTINGRKYPIACDDGQEAHLSRLAAYIDNRIKELVAAVGQVDHTRLLVMVSLLVADELSDAYAEIESTGAGSTGDSGKELGVGQKHRNIADLARRVEHVAEALEQT